MLNSMGSIAEHRDAGIAQALLWAITAGEPGSRWFLWSTLWHISVLYDSVKARPLNYTILSVLAPAQSGATCFITSTP